jgi:YHS domain-containing protein
MDIKAQNGISMVCGRCITGDSEYFPSSEYLGKKVFFCTDYCLRAFLSDPDTFMQAHQKSSQDFNECDLLD